MLEDLIGKKTVAHEDIYEWCKENLKGEVLVGDKAIFIKEDSDVVAFKIRWL